MSFQDVFWAAPPVSRTITAATVLLSVPGHLGFYSLAWVVFLKDYVFTIRQLPQIWRLVTCFFLTGPQLGLIMDPFFLYHYSSQLETGSPRFSAPGAYAFYLFFVASVIMLTGGIYLGGVTLLNPLSMALIYTFAQEDPNRVVSFFIVQMPAKYLPYASLAITYLLAGPFATMVQATGILAAHLYDFLDRIWPQFGGGQQWIRVPQFVQKTFATPGGTGQARTYGTAFGARAGGQRQTVQQNQTGSGGGWTSGSAWGSRGSGRRLGGE
ncbi:related to F-LANa [Lecanosticta acicola]|uniref:Derlin n=1 Tax=Lecanosticta acicola TaxID=111012 RepID=A0AAI9E7R9_9PEZI|nr:related to F-LANa [Lecanosticta acicola]